MPCNRASGQRFLDADVSRNIEHDDVLPSTLCPSAEGQDQRSARSNMNDDRSPLLDMMTCIDCNRPMKLEKIDPDGKGNDLIQYRCKTCHRFEIVRLFRRSWTT